MQKLSVFGLVAASLLALAPTESAFAGGYPGCNCTPRPPIVRREVAPRPSGQVCVTACMTPGDWANCATKSWWADSKDHAYKTPRFFSRCGTVCRPANSPRLGYRAASGNWVVFRFGPGS